MGLRAYILKRALNSVALVLLVITLNFIIFTALPGDPALRLANRSKLTPEVREAQLRNFGLLDPPHIRYVKYMQSMLTFQFGYSYSTGLPIYNEIFSRLELTLTLCITAEIIALFVGLILGVFAAHKMGGIFDTSSSLLSIVTNSLPVFWVGLVLILIFAFGLHWLPEGFSAPPEWALLPGQVPGNLWIELMGRLRHLILPAATLVVVLAGTYFLLTRASMVEVLTEDYLVTARAKGLSERVVLFKHAFKNASLPVVTHVALEFGFMLAGATVTETVFQFPGLGMWIWKSIDYVDFPALQAIFFLIALCVIIANFIADVLYGVIDPRIKYE